MVGRGRPSHVAEPARGREGDDEAWRMGWAPREVELKKILTMSKSAAEMSQKQAHFVWEKYRARTTYIVNRVPRKTFWRI